MEKSNFSHDIWKDSIVNRINPAKKSQNYGIVWAGEVLQAHLAGNVLKKGKGNHLKGHIQNDLETKQIHLNKIPFNSVMNSSVNGKILVKSFFQYFWIHLKNQNEAGLGN